MNPKKLVVEFIGTFFLVFTVGMHGLPSGADATTRAFAGLAIGSSLMIMIFAGGHISGAHYNPAVSLAVFLRGKCTPADLGGYIVAQILASLVAALLALTLTDFPKEVKPLDPNLFRALLAEFIFTFALCYVVLNVATAKATSGNSFYGLAIGFTVVVGAYAVGGVSGGAFNPAVATGATVMGILKAANIWMYYLGELAAGAAAAAVFLYVNGKD